MSVLRNKVEAKLPILADAAKYDASCASSGSKSTVKDAKIGSTEGMGICHSYTPDGRCVSLLKILLTNYCIYDCKYCINRVSSDTPRARFSVEEVVWLTMEFYKRNYIEGLFLSSGIIQSSDYTMEQLASVARSLREEQRFGGYIHLKTIPGADPKLVALAGRYADRLSVNVELPTAQDLNALAPEKKLGEIHSTMDGIKEKLQETKADQAKGFKAEKFAPAGQSTQMIVGATDANDSQILQTASQLYQKQSLRRVYYSAFSPIPDASSQLPLVQPPLIREHRLYQADWLMRFYQFDVDEIVTSRDGHLDLRIDPKLAWALANLNRFPVDVQRADSRDLLRIPGVGAKTVKKILQLRKHASIRTADLLKLGVVWKRAKFFVKTADSDKSLLQQIDRPDFASRFLPPPNQLTLFDL